jgi:hypothetical protein
MTTPARTLAAIPPLRARLCTLIALLGAISDHLVLLQQLAGTPGACPAVDQTAITMALDDAGDDAIALAAETDALAEALTTLAQEPEPESHP